MLNMLKKAFKAATFNQDVFTDFIEEPTSILHSFGVVLLVGIVLGLGMTNILEEGVRESISIDGLVNRLLEVWMSVLTVLVCWILWAGVTYFLGVRWLGGVGSFRQVLRVIGISYGPCVLFIFSSIKILSILYFVGAIWALIVAVIGVKKTINIDWIGIVLSTFVGWFIFLALLPPYILRSLLVSVN